MSNGLLHSSPPAVSKLRVEGVPEGTEGTSVNRKGLWAWRTGYWDKEVVRRELWRHSHLLGCERAGKEVGAEAGSQPELLEK